MLKNHRNTPSIISCAAPFLYQKSFSEIVLENGIPVRQQSKPLHIFPSGQ